MTMTLNHRGSSSSSAVRRGDRENRAAAGTMAVMILIEVLIEGEETLVVEVEEMMPLDNEGGVKVGVVEMVLVAEEVITVEAEGGVKEVREEDQEVIKKTSQCNLTRESRSIFVKLKLPDTNISMELHPC
jgi:hypothetical protein